MTPPPKPKSCARAVIVVALAAMLLFGGVMWYIHSHQTEPQPKPPLSRDVFLYYYSLRIDITPINSSQHDCFFFGIYSGLTTRAENPYMDPNRFIANYSGSVYGENCGSYTKTINFVTNGPDVRIFYYDLFIRNGTQGYKITFSQLVYIPYDYFYYPTVPPARNYISVASVNVPAGTLEYSTGIDQFHPPSFISSSILYYDVKKQTILYP